MRAIVHDDTVYVSGTVPRTNALVDGDMRAQAKQVVENLASPLETAGSSLGRVVKVTVFLADTEDRPAFNEVYTGYVNEPYLARTAVGVDR